jgi:hypothetical protein
MTSSFRTRAMIAIATAGAAGALWSAVLPDHRDYDSPAGRQARIEREYADHRERELEELRAKGNRDAEAIRRDRMRPGVHSTPDPRRVARALIRRP